MNRRIVRRYSAVALSALSAGCGGISGSNIHSGTSQSASPGSPTTNVDLNVTLNAAAPIGGSYTTPLEMVYDVNGGAQDVDFVFSRTGLNTWKFDVEKPIGNATLLPQGQDVQLQFATNGSLDNIKVTNPDGSVLNENKVPVTGANGDGIDWGSGAPHQTFTVRLKGSTQVSAPFKTVSFKKDGHARTSASVAVPMQSGSLSL